MLILRHFEHFFDRIDPTGVIYCFLYFMEGLAWCFFFAWCLSSCTRTAYQDREVVRHDSIYVTALSVDTILQRDSVHVLERGDTVYKNVQKYVYKVKERRDTCYVQRTDTVLQTETKEVQKTVRKNDWLELVGGAAVAFLIGFFFAPFVRKKE